MDNITGLWSHPDVPPDAGFIMALARECCSAGYEDFARALERELGRPVSVGTLRAWERRQALPPPDVFLAALRLAGVLGQELSARVGRLDDVKRRSFLGLMALASGGGPFDVERFAAAVDDWFKADDPMLDNLETLTRTYASR